MKIAWVLVLVGVGCGGDDIDSDTEARWAYLGFDAAIDRAINLGFDGFNEANSANIPAQVADADLTGTMRIGGQVDQGASANKEMRLAVGLVDYNDGAFDDLDTEGIDVLAVTYNTVEGMEPTLDMSLRDIPNGTFTGALVGRFIVDGSVDAEGADFNLTLAGSIIDGGLGTVIREPGTLTIVGTVTSGDGTYNVDVSR